MPERVRPWPGLIRYQGRVWSLQEESLTVSIAEIACLSMERKENRLLAQGPINLTPPFISIQDNKKGRINLPFYSPGVPLLG